jgi:hypothetical protein
MGMGFNGLHTAWRIAGGQQNTNAVKWFSFTDDSGQLEHMLRIVLLFFMEI